MKSRKSTVTYCGSPVYSIVEMNDSILQRARLSNTERIALELIEMKACMGLLDEQIQMLQKYKKIRYHQAHPEGDPEFHALMAAVAESTAEARQWNARVLLTLSQRLQSIESQSN